MACTKKDWRTTNRNFATMKRNILIPKLRSPPMYETTAKNLIFMGRGGLILSPVTGLHENVVVQKTLWIQYREGENTVLRLSA